MYVYIQLQTVPKYINMYVYILTGVYPIAGLDYWTQLYYYTCVCMPTGIYIDYNMHVQKGPRLRGSNSVSFFTPARYISRYHLRQH